MCQAHERCLLGGRSLLSGVRALTADALHSCDVVVLDAVKVGIIIVMMYCCCWTCQLVLKYVTLMTHPLRLLVNPRKLLGYTDPLRRSCQKYYHQCPSWFGSKLTLPPLC